MKILLLNLWRVIDSKGGTEKVFFNMANALSEKGYDIVALALEDRVGKPFFSIAPKVKFINVGIGFKNKLTLKQKICKIFIVNREKKRLFKEKILDERKAIILRPILEKEKPDIIVSFSMEATRILVNHINMDVPIISMFHFDPDTILKDIADYTRNALEKSACIQVLLENDIARTRKYIDHKNIKCIPNIVPQHECPPVVELRDRCIITVARIDENQKRQHLLIEAFNKIKESYSDWRVEIWGETDCDKKYYRYCLALLKKYNLEKQIVFCGTTNNVDEKLKQASIFAFPSAFEGFALAMTEGMSLGVPVVGYRSCTSVRELIKDRYNGLLCEDGIDDFAAKLALLMHDDKLREQLGRNAHESMKAFSPEKIWDTWEKLIIETVENQKSVE